MRELSNDLMPDGSLGTYSTEVLSGWELTAIKTAVHLARQQQLKRLNQDKLAALMGKLNKAHEIRIVYSE